MGELSEYRPVSPGCRGMSGSSHTGLCVQDGALGARDCSGGRKAHDICLGRRFADDFAHDAPFPQDENLVRESEHLGKIRRRKENRDTGARQVLQEQIDLFARPYVDTARRLVE